MQTIYHILLLTTCLSSNIQSALHMAENKYFEFKNSWGCRPPHSNYLASLLGLEEPSLKLLRSAELQRTNSSPISNCQRSKSAIFISRNINSNINSLLRLRVGTHIIYIYIYISIGRALHTGSRNENNIGAACGSP